MVFPLWIRQNLRFTELRTPKWDQSSRSWPRSEHGSGLCIVFRGFTKARIGRWQEPKWPLRASNKKNLTYFNQVESDSWVLYNILEWFARFWFLTFSPKILNPQKSMGLGHKWRTAIIKMVDRSIVSVSFRFQGDFSQGRSTLAVFVIKV